jgi:hypothetical protein
MLRNVRQVAQQLEIIRTDSENRIKVLKIKNTLQRYDDVCVHFLFSISQSLTLSFSHSHSLSFTLTLTLTHSLTLSFSLILTLSLFLTLFIRFKYQLNDRIVLYLSNDCLLLGIGNAESSLCERGIHSTHRQRQSLTFSSLSLQWFASLGKTIQRKSTKLWFNTLSLVSTFLSLSLNFISSHSFHSFQRWNNLWNTNTN